MMTDVTFKFLMGAIESKASTQKRVAPARIAREENFTIELTVISTYFSSKIMGSNC